MYDGKWLKGAKDIILCLSIDSKTTGISYGLQQVYTTLDVKAWNSE